MVSVDKVSGGGGTTAGVGGGEMERARGRCRVRGMRCSSVGARPRLRADNNASWNLSRGRAALVQQEVAAISAVEAANRAGSEFRVYSSKTTANPKEEAVRQAAKKEAATQMATVRCGEEASWRWRRQ